jgi:hypothetical protein
VAAQTIRELLTRLGVDADTLAVQQFDAAIENAKTGMERATRVAAVLVGGITALTTGIVAQTLATGRSAEEAIRQAEALGITVEKFQELRAVVQDFDADTGDLVDAIATIADRSEDAAAGMESMAEDFALVGITIDKEFLALNPEERFLAFADAVSQTEDDSKRLTATVRVLGDDAGRKLGPLMQLGADGIRKLREEARLAGLVLDKEAAEKAAAAARSFRRLQKMVKGVRTEIGVAFAPIVQVIFDRMTDWILANRALIQQRLEDTVARIERGVEVLGEKLREVDRIVREDVGGWEVIFQQVAKAAAFGGLIAALRVLVPLLKGASLAFAAISASPVVLLIGALALAITALLLIGEDFLVFMRGGQSAIGTFLDEFERADEIRDALKRLFKTIERAVEISPIVQLLGVAFKGIGAAIEAVTPAVERFLDEVILESLLNIERVINNLTASFENLIDLFEGVAEFGAFVREDVRALFAPAPDTGPVQIPGAPPRVAAAPPPEPTAVQSAIQSAFQTVNALARSGAVGLLSGAPLAAAGEAARSGDSITINGVGMSAAEIEELLNRREADRQRRAMAATRGGER